jgi:hypothetical protein
MIIIHDIKIVGCFVAYLKLLYRVHSIKMDATSQVLYHATQRRIRASYNLEVLRQLNTCSELCVALQTVAMICFVRHFLGALGKLQKATVSFVISICPSVCPHGTIRLTRNGLS